MKFKRIISVLLAVVIVSSVACLPSYAATDKMPDLLIGDADLDGAITVMDATAIALHLAKKKTLDEMNLQTAKTDFSTEVLSVIDATIIQQKVADIDNDDTREVGLPAFFYINGEYVPALEEYQRYLENLMKRYGYSGVAYASRNGRVLCQTAQGMENTELNIEMSMDSKFGIGSISKQFCATAVLMLQDQGKLSVNDTIDKYFPEYKYASQITIHDLLCMRSGIFDYLNENPDVYFDYDTEEENEEAILEWAFSQELKLPPDTKYSYSNTNFFLLSLIVEQVTGMVYHDFLQQNILDVLSMDDTGFYDELVHTEGVAEWRIPEGYEIFYPVGLLQGAGDLVSDASDIDKWLTAMADGVLLSSDSYKMMTTNYNGADNYGYGIHVEKHEKYSHTGSVPTYHSSVITYARENINIFVVTNDAVTASINDFDIEIISKQLANKIR